MKDLLDFVKNEFNKKALFEEGLLVDTIAETEKLVSEVSYGKYVNIVFKNSSMKDIFIDKLLTARPDANIINCNCSLDKFSELNINNLSGLLVFNNIKKCKHSEIIETIKNYKGIMIC